jgi:hypothetical protein
VLTVSGPGPQLHVTPRPHRGTVANLGLRGTLPQIARGPAAGGEGGRPSEGDGCGCAGDETAVSQLTEPSAMLMRPTVPTAGGMRASALRLPIDGSTDVRIFARRVRWLCPVGARDLAGTAEATRYQAPRISIGIGVDPTDPSRLPARTSGERHDEHHSSQASRAEF